MCNHLGLATYPEGTVWIDLSTRRITEHFVTATLEVDLFVSCSRAENEPGYFPPVRCARLEYKLKFVSLTFGRENARLGYPKPPFHSG